MTQTKAIAKFCRECVGGNARDVTLCTGFNCPLWPFRLGCTMRSKVYAARVRGTWAAGGYAVKETAALGLKMDDFLHPRRIKSSGQGEGEIARPSAEKGTYGGSGAAEKSDQA